MGKVELGLVERIGKLESALGERIARLEQVTEGFIKASTQRRSNADRRLKWNGGQQEHERHLPLPRWR